MNKENIIWSNWRGTRKYVGSYERQEARQGGGGIHIIPHSIFLLPGCYLGYTTQVWSPKSILSLKQLENVQRHATKLTLKLPFCCDVTYKTRFQLTNLLPIQFILARVFDIVFFYKAVTNLVFIDSKALPVTRQSTRFTWSLSRNAITYIPKRSRAVTYQRSFFICACRTCNILPTPHLRASPSL